MIGFRVIAIRTSTVIIVTDFVHAAASTHIVKATVPFNVETIFSVVANLPRSIAFDLIYVAHFAFEIRVERAILQRVDVNLAALDLAS